MESHQPAAAAVSARWMDVHGPDGSAAAQSAARQLGIGADQPEVAAPSSSGPQRENRRREPDARSGRARLRSGVAGGYAGRRPSIASLWTSDVEPEPPPRRSPMPACAFRRRCCRRRGAGLRAAVLRVRARAACKPGLADHTIVVDGPCAGLEPSSRAKRPLQLRWAGPEPSCPWRCVEVRGVVARDAARRAPAAGVTESQN